MKTNKTNRAFFGGAAVSAMAVVAMAAGAGLVTAASPPAAEAAVAEAHRRAVRVGPHKICLPFECRGDVCCVWMEPPKR